MNHGLRHAAIGLIGLALAGVLLVMTPSTASPDDEDEHRAAAHAEPAWGDGAAFPAACSEMAAQPGRHCLFY